MIVDRHRKRFLGDILADDVLIEQAADLHRLRHTNGGRLASRVFVKFFVEDALADVDAAVANVNARPGDQLAHLGVAFATKRAHGQVRGAGHIFPLMSSSYSRILRGRAASATAVERSPEGGAAPSSSFTSLRDLITSSTKP